MSFVDAFVNLRKAWRTMTHDKLALRALTRDLSGQDCADPIRSEELRAIGYAVAARANSVADIEAVLAGIASYAVEHGWKRALQLVASQDHEENA